MPRKPKLAVVPESAVPSYIQEAPIMRRRKITKRRLPSYAEAMMLLHAPEALRLFWKSLLEGESAGDKDSVRMVGEIFEYLKRGGGISIVQQMLQQNAVAGATSPVIGFDAFARSLAEARAGHALPPPAEDVITVHPVESPQGE